ncbi:MAG: hypothetical protein ACETWR_08400 [Anaerolineae bacterium]
MMEITEATINRNGPVRALAEFKWPMGLAARRKVVVAATVLVVLVLAAWAMIGFHADRLSHLPRTGNPMPALAAFEADSTLEAELALVTTALTRRDVSGAVLMEAVYNTPELFATLSRYHVAQQGGDEVEAESLFQTYLSHHETDRYLVFMLILESSGPDLTDYQPQAVSRLRTASEREVPAENWVEMSSSMSDHRRVGLLHFPRATADGQALLTEDDGWLELVLSVPDGGEQALRWELPIAYPTIPTT